MLYRRYSGVPLPAARWEYLQAFGYLVSVSALCFVATAFILAHFPTVPSPFAESIDWSVVVTLAIVIVATVYYVVRGSNTFEGPAVKTKKAEDESMIVMEDIVIYGKQLWILDHRSNKSDYRRYV